MFSETRLRDIYLRVRVPLGAREIAVRTPLPSVPSGENSTRIKSLNGKTSTLFCLHIVIFY